MKKFTYPIIAVQILAMMTFSCKQKSIDYPETRMVDTVDTYFGTTVPDPYRWLEDDRSEETAAWVKAENEITDSCLQEIPFRDKIRDRLETLWNFPRMGMPSREGNYIFYSYNDGLQNQDVVFIKKNGSEEGEIFLDPNTFSDDGTIALTNFSVSNDAKYVGYGISKGGSDWNEFFVKEIESGKVLEDHLMWIKFSGISWFKDGFFYSRYDKPSEDDQLKGMNINNKLYYHKIGEPQERDELIYEDPSNPGWGFGGYATEDEKHLIIVITESTTGNAVYYMDLTQVRPELIKLVDNFESDYMPVGSIDEKLYFLTNNDAPMYKLVSIDPVENQWNDIIPANTEKVLKSCSFAGNQIIATFEKDARSLIERFTIDGKPAGEIELPGIGSVGSVSAKKKYNDFYYSYTSFNVPSIIYHYNLGEGKSEVYHKTEVNDFNPDDYITEQVFYPSKDGTKIPMFIVHKKGLKMDGKRPTLLYGYGGFNITLTPSFSVRTLIWLENNGVYALANIRGGGEYGEGWHQAGTILNKQNVFDDFISAAEYLQNNKYTSPKRLTIFGGSNGGLLVGAVTNQRPELFAVALPAVGVMDMLRFHKFTIGRYWVTDYGSSDDSIQFNYLYKYSPLHNIDSKKTYPAIMVTTADHDDRVVPAHSFKYIATLQEKVKGKNPLLIRIETDAGHGAGKPISKTLDEYADLWSFAFYNMDFVPEF